MNELNELAHRLIHERKYEDAIGILQKSINADRKQWNTWYLLGQCFRFIGEFSNSIECLEYSVSLNSNYSHTYLSLGIAYQLAGNYEQSLLSLKKATDLDEFFIIPYNSAGMTLKLMGNFAESIETYEQGLTKLAISFIKNTNNNYNEKILPHIDTVGSFHNQYLLKAALYVSSQDGIDKLVFPTGHSAMIEYEEKTHGGLLWEDYIDKNKKIRNYLPNFFMSGLNFLVSENLYSTMLVNLSTVLHMNGQFDLSIEHLKEANEFKYLYDNLTDL